MINRSIKILRFINIHPIAKLHKLKSFYRFISWQLSQMIFPGERKIPFIMNTKLLVKKGMTGATGNIYTGLHDFEDMGFLLHFLRKNDLFFDIGANVGAYSILASGIKQAKSFSVEPIPTTFNYLEKNIRLNNLQLLIKAKNIGLGKGAGKLKFTSNHDTINHVAISKNIEYESVVDVEVNSFDNIIKEEGIPILIKVDVEGFETEVFKGINLDLVGNDLKAIIIELNGSGKRYGFDESLIHNYLLKSGYLPYQYEPFKRNLIPLESFGSNNTIYINDFHFVYERLKSSEPFQIFSESI